MNCPRCGERLFGSVCPRCGNVVVQRSQTTNQRSSQRTQNTNYSRNNDNIRFMDSNGTKTLRPAKKKKNGSNSIIKIIIGVLVLLCIIFFFMYNSAKSELANVQNEVNNQNETIKSKNDEISKLKEQIDKLNKELSGEKSDEDSDAPDVEFDENGNLVNITDNSSSESDEDSDDEGDKKYKSGDTYTIKENDNGTAICKAIYGKYTPELWEKILKANNMTASSSYHPGDELKIP